VWVVAVAAIVMSCLVCSVFGNARRAEREADAAEAQARATQLAPMPVPAPPGPCSTYSATNSNSSPRSRAFEADLINGRIEDQGLRPGRAVVEGDSLVLANMTSCDSATVQRALTGDSLRSFVHMLCTANGFREIRCDTATQQRVLSVDLEHGCRCVDRFTCDCPTP